MRILITGGGGYIGSVLMARLPRDHELICLDHGRHYSRLRGIVGKNVKLIKGDIMDRELMNRSMKGADAVLHMAGGGGNDACMRDPARSVMTNIHGTNLLLKAAEQNGVDRFIFTSSYVAYSTFLKRRMPLTEDMELMPDEFYGALKAASEHEVAGSGLDYVILRLSNVYGYGLGLGHEWEGVAGRFIRSAHESRTIPVYGSGSQKIDLFHVEDACRAISMMIQDRRIRNERFNVGSGKPTPVAAIAEAVARAFRSKSGKSPKIVRMPAPPGKVWPDRWTSIEKIKKRTGWKPEIGLESGISGLMSRYEGG